VFHLDPLPPGDALRLSGGEGRHAATVRRLRPGETVEVTDGRGELAECTVTRAGRDELDLAVVRRRYVPPPRPRLVVVQALAKGERAELAVELLTEAGVDEVVPWQAERSVVRWDRERAGRALGRWRSTAREAAKQSRRAHWPVIAEPVDTAAAAARLAAADLALVLHPAGEVPLGEVVVPVDGDIVVVVGPEGGLGDGERAAFAAAGALVCRAGPTVLRASTAGAVAAAVLLSRSPRWS
jgi:16S rRNA (uracil1498-N3)-methyltransferase